MNKKKQSTKIQQSEKPILPPETLKPQKRVKQKFLAQIVAKNRNKVDQSARADVTKNPPKSNNPESVQKTAIKSSKPPASTAITFSKSSETGLKTILAKPKKQNSSSKSLADIFANKNDDKSKNKSLTEILAQRSVDVDEHIDSDLKFQSEKNDRNTENRKFPHKRENKRGNKFNKDRNDASAEDKPERTYSSAGKVLLIH